MPTHLVLLAAGQGTRMKSGRPKVLHEIAGLPMFAHALRSAGALSPDRRVIVVGHGGAAVEAAARAIDPDVSAVTQSEQLGTGHAVLQAKPVLDGAGGDTVVLYADTPFIRPDTLQRMQDARRGGADVVVLGFRAADPAKYGRLILSGDRLDRIVEWKDASNEERALNLCNSGVIMADTALLFELLAEVRNDNSAGEYYLTDVVGLARARGLTAAAVICEEAETLGVNSRADLAAAEAAFQARMRAEMMASGVTLVAPDTVYLAHDTSLGQDVFVEPNVFFGPAVTVEAGATIRAFSHLEACRVGAGAVVGPFARIRPGSDLGDGARVGNFCEVKNATLGENAKVNHLSYIGDASVGAGTNIGAGTVTCNYDGVSKHRTEIGDGVFIGSNTMLVAPVRVGDGAMTATSTTVTADIPAEALAIGRAKQENKPGFAARLRNKLRAAKARQKG